MGLPVWLGVDRLKRRLDIKASDHDGLLAELLEGALAQAQAEPPFGTGRLLAPDPVLDAEGNDTAEPVERTVEVWGRRVLVPDARELTDVAVEDPWSKETETITEYSTVKRDGVTVRLDLHRECWNRWWGQGEFGYVYQPRARERKITLTGRFGFLVPPDNVIGAIYTLAARRWYERAANYADAVVVAEGAQASQYFKVLPPEVRTAFAPFALAQGIGGLS